MTSGVITGITQDWRGDTLTEDAADVDTVLQVEDAADFDDEFADQRWLVVGDETTPREYVAVDKDANTITLADPVGGTGLEVDLPVVMWDPTVGDTGSRAVEYVATVRLHDDSGFAPAIIPHELIPASGVYGLVGASVSIDDEDDEDDWTISRVLGRETVVDGSFIPPDTLPDPAAPTEAPAESPALTTQGLTSSIILSADAVEPTTEITYQISTDYDPDTLTGTWGDLNADPTRDRIYATRTLADGSTPLAADTVYYFRSIASNVVDAAAPSDPVSGQLDLDAVTVAADAVVTERLDSPVVITNRLEVGASCWTPDELVLNATDGSVTQLGGAENRFDGHIHGRSATFDDNTNLGGTTLVYGAVRGVNGITNPTQAPGVSRSWDSLALDVTSPDLLKGLCDSSSGINWLTAYAFGGLFVLAANKGTGGTLATEVTGTNLTLFAPSGGITRIGTNHYVLGQDLNRSGRWFVYVLDSSFAKTGEWEYTHESSSTRDPALGNDGTNVVIARTAGPASVNAGKPQVRTYVASTGAVTSGGLTGATLVTCDTDVDADLGGVFVGAADFGATRILVATRTGSSDVRAYNTSGVLQTSHNFKRANGARIRGLTLDASGFHSLDFSGVVWDYTEKITSQSVDVAKTDYDGNSTGGTHETMVGPTATFTWDARSRLVISMAPPPQAGAVGDDVADRVRAYAGPAGGTLRLQASPAAGTTTVELTALDTGSATPPASNEFTAIDSAVGIMAESTGLDAAGIPLIQLDGAGNIGRDTDDLLASGSYGGSVRLIRFGNIVYAVGEITRATGFSTTMHDTGVVAPTGMRPTADTVFPGHSIFNSATTYRFRVLSTGALQIQESAASSQSFFVNEHWYID